MSRTITALFDTRSEAEAARERLTQSNIDAGRVRIVDQAEASQSQGQSGHDGSIWSSLKDAFVADDDRSGYEEGVRRGGCLLCAQVDEHEADQAVRVLEETGSIDFDRRQEQWRSEGWTGASAQQQSQQPHSQQAQQQQFAAQSQTETSEQRIPIVEEMIKVGKREVERGGARVRSYVQETPVSEQVTLREEHVNIERRPVDQQLSSADLSGNDMLQERTVEMHAHGEEAVVAKDARVKEELVIQKTADQHSENVQDSVRETRVDVDENISDTGGFDEDRDGRR
jgi:stress response protein YsnF